MPKTEVQAFVEVPTHGLPDFEPANFFHFSASGPEVALSVGMIDVTELANIRQRPRTAASKQARIIPRISHRFFLSARGLLILQQNVNEIVKQMRSLGMVGNEDGQISTANSDE